MLNLVIETFRNADPVPIGERFKSRGRMLPEGLTYQSSWIDAKNARCYQLMEALDPALLAAWTRNWDDLVDFEIIPVQASADYWAQFQNK
jgi:hypothetical protein